MRKAVTMVVSVVAVLAAAAVSLATAANAAVGCRVTYTVYGSWPGGFTTGVEVTNLGDPVTSWTLRFRFPADQQITHGWGAGWSQAGPEVTATNAGWNGTLAANASTLIGFNGASGSSNPVPTSFSLNGITCNAGLPTVTPIGTPPVTVTPPPVSGTSTSSTGPFDPAPVVTLISPVDGATFTSPAMVLIHASATIAGGRSISRVNFVVDGVVVGTTTSAPSNATFTWAAPVGEPGTTATYTVTAVAISNQGFAGISRPAVITVVTP